jgi:hypothetical protein
MRSITHSITERGKIERSTTEQLASTDGVQKSNRRQRNFGQRNFGGLKKGETVHKRGEISVKELHQNCNPKV